VSAPDDEPVTGLRYAHRTTRLPTVIAIVVPSRLAPPRLCRLVALPFESKGIIERDRNRIALKQDKPVPFVIEHRSEVDNIPRRRLLDRLMNPPLKVAVLPRGTAGDEDEPGAQRDATPRQARNPMLTLIEFETRHQGSDGGLEIQQLDSTKLRAPQSLHETEGGSPASAGGLDGRPASNCSTNRTASPSETSVGPTSESAVGPVAGLVICERSTWSVSRAPLSVSRARVERMRAAHAHAALIWGAIHVKR
jgi:hypothetical protein